MRIEGDFALELSRTPAGNTKKKIIKFGGLGAFGARSGAFDGATPAYLEGKKGGFDPHERIKDMDAEGIDAAFLYPSLALFLGGMSDPVAAAAACRAYNRWLVEEVLLGLSAAPVRGRDAADAIVGAGTR